MMELEQNYQDLIVAICIKAAQDYVWLMRHGGDRWKLTKIEDFFLSDKFKLYMPELDGRQLVEDIKRCKKIPRRKQVPGKKLKRREEAAPLGCQNRTARCI